jgi:subtilase family serine protease
MLRSRRRVLSLTAVTSLALAGVALPALTTAAQAASPRSVVRDSQPSWAVHSAEVAPAPVGKQVKARVYLAARDTAALDRAVTAVSTPSSPSFGKYLTPAQYRARFGPAATSVTKLTSWLRQAGLNVSAPQQNGRYLLVTGSVATAERAFGTKLGMFRHDGGSYQAPAASITVPSDLAPYVLTVTGLNEAPTRVTTKVDNGSAVKPQLSKQKAPADESGPPAFHTAKPCSLWYGQFKARDQLGGKVALPTYQGQTLPYTVCGYKPSQLRSAYEAPASLTGKGVTVAVIDAYQSDTLLPDANQYATNTGTAKFTANQFNTLVPAGGYTDQQDCDSVGWSTEQSLDVEAVHGFAPGANVLYAGARSCSTADLFDAQTAVVDDNRASIVSLSYGSIESTETADEAALDTALFKQAALQGIGFYIASGDNGDEELSTGTKQVDTSGNNPYATAVGGTALGIGPQGQYWFEAGYGSERADLSADGKSWQDAFFFGGAGGGASALFPKPVYQNGVLGTAGLTGRGEPDVGMLADPNTGMLIGLTQEFPLDFHYDQYRVGGTSLASPLFAAAQALTSQALKMRLGFANPRIYALYNKQIAGGAKTFHDVTNAYDGLANVRADYLHGLRAEDGMEYSVRTFDDDSSLTTSRGWDPVTGVGSPRAAFYTATGS